MAFSFDPASWFQAYLNVALAQDFVWKDGADRAPIERRHRSTIKEAFVCAPSAPEAGCPLQIGRQRFEDERQWLYDEELDAVRLRYDARDLRGRALGEAGRARPEGRARSGPAERVNNYVLFASYNPLDWLELEGYVIVRDDRTADRRRPVFVGLRSRGEPVEDLDYWLELAYVGGRDGLEEHPRVGRRGRRHLRAPGRSTALVHARRRLRQR